MPISQTVSTDEPPANDRGVPSLYRVRPFPTLIGALHRSAERGSMQKAIYAFSYTLGVVVLAGVFVILIFIAPDGSSASHTTDVLLEWRGTLTGFLALMGVVLFPAMLWVNALAGAKLYQADTSPGHRLTWLAFGSDLGLIIIFAILTGLFAGNLLLAGHVDPEITHALHVVTLVSAYVLGFLWAPFFIVFVVVSRRVGHLFPVWLERLAILSMITNFFAFVGLFSLTGPFNAMNGILCLPLQSVGQFIFVAGLTGYLIIDDLPAGLARINRVVNPAPAH